MFKKYRVTDFVTLTKDSVIGCFNPFPHKKINDVEILIKEYCKGWYLIVGEGKESKEHIHFVLSGLSIKIDSLKKIIRKKFPCLVRDKTGKKGGANKVVVRYIKKPIQFYYLFKDVHIMRKNFTIDVEESIKTYEEMKKEKKGGDYDKCYEYVKEKIDYIQISTQCVKKISYLVLKYLDQENKSLRTYSIVERYISYILSKEDMRAVANMYADTYILRHNQ